ncbi:hypothetical protein B566_EDAN010651 [Ephemera danica]|nr:hypothetical protein B566_EDAN010651 [Ephemera danica]
MLGLPLMCVHPVPCNTMFGSQQKMDVAALKRLMEEDTTAGRVPLIVLADAGTPVAGHVDNLGRLQEVCREHDVWLHLRGHSLAALAMATAPAVPSRVADSLTLPIGVWLGVPALPVTLFRTFESTQQQQPQAGVKSVRGRESTLPLIAGLTVEHFTLRLSCLSLWTSLQSLGREGIQSRLKQAFEASEQLHNKLAKYPCLRLLNQKPGGETGSISVTELATKPVSTAILFEVIACTVVFQFVPEGSEDKTDRVPAYFDKLNSWLGQILQRDAPQVPLEICDLESSGVILRFCPLELAVERLPSPEELEQFIACIEQQLVRTVCKPEILTATVQHKETFVRLAEASPRLRLVNMPQWAGLGGVRYLPEVLDLQIDEPLTDQTKEELNQLNSRLVEQLRSTDAAFSLGEGIDGLVCVRFGMVTAETDVEELLGLVESVGREVEESSRYLESLTEIVKKGIETATQDLQKENAERLWQEGILRHVPVVGSLVNWWSPPSKESGIKGRSLNLTAGTPESGFV